MKTTHPETTLAELKLQCALLGPLLNGTPPAATAPVPAIRADFTAASPVELTQAQIHALRVALGHIPAAAATAAAPRVMMPTGAAQGVTKTAPIPHEISQAKRDWIEHQNRKFGNFRPRG